jgi:hypothetical protein
MRTEVKLINPKLAQLYLERNKGNRKVNDALVNYFADQMNRGLWKLTGQGISFDYDGNLIDGQHRLKAVVKSNVAVNFLVIFDIDGESFKVYDSGKMRSGSDVFGIKGIPSSAQTSSAIYKYLILKKGFKYFSKGRTSVLVTIEDQINEYNIDNELWNEIIKYSSRLYSKYRFYPTSVVGGTIVYLIKEKKHSKSKVYQFFNELYNIENSRPSITLLREKIIKDALSRKGYSNKDKFIFLKKCWNLYITNKNVTIYKNSPEEKEIDFLS